jgi:hypothetical protein
MPVQFIGGSSGGTTDVRTTFADPVLNDALANTTTIVAKYQIPANYLTINDVLKIKYIAQFGLANTGAVTFQFYIGPTGTTADSLITLNTTDVTVYRPTASSYGQFYLDSNFYFYAVGVNGLATMRFTGITKTSSSTGGNSSITGSAAVGSNATVDTTQPLYISLAAITPTTAVVDTLGSYITVGY